MMTVPTHRLSLFAMEAGDFLDLLKREADMKRQKKRIQHTGSTLLCIVLAGAALLFSGCGSTVSELLSDASRYAGTRTEEAYYLQPPAYRLSKLLEEYTAPARTIAFVEAESEALPDFAMENDEHTGNGSDSNTGSGNEGGSDTDSGNTEDSIIRSDECVSSKAELTGLLENAMEQAALGAVLSFDRNGWLVQTEELKQWMSEYAQTHPLETLCLEQAMIFQKVSGTKETVALVFTYSSGRSDVVSLREQTKTQAQDIAAAINPDQNLSEEELAHAVWLWMTEHISWPKDADGEWQTQTDAIPDSCFRADSALINGEAVGQGYAEAAVLLFRELGMQCEIIQEPARNGEETQQNVREAFKNMPEKTQSAQDSMQTTGKNWFYNQVLIDGKPYRIDFCFGALTGQNEDFYKFIPETE